MPINDARQPVREIADRLAARVERSGNPPGREGECVACTLT